MNTLKYPNLFRPIKIKNLMIQNRIIANPMGQKFEDKALGGPGIIIAGSCIVEPGRSSFASKDEPDAFSKYEVEKTRERILIAHQTGAKASIELGHAGMYARTKDYCKSSTGLIREDGVEVREMDEQMMNETADCFAQTAKNARDLGFDMIFLHFGHGWLVSQFLSPLFNKRTDEYGGSIENRMRFPLMILERIRKAVGPNFVVDMRVSAIEWVPGGIEFDDTLAFVKAAEKFIDIVQISSGLDINHEGNVHMATTNFEPHMTNVPYAKIVKQNVHIAVSVVGAIANPDEAEKLLADGTVDMVAMARPLVADPELPIKAREGRSDDIVPCIRCLQCYHIATNRRNVGCSVNPRYANESFVPRKLTKAAVSKKVVVIGAGPAGIKAALVAEQRGHTVTLLEKKEYLGGALHFIAREKYKQDIQAYLTYLTGQIRKSSVDVRLNYTATVPAVKDMNPDAVIIAVGAVPSAPKIKGIEKNCVMGFYDALEHEEKIGSKVVIIGGGTIGVEIGLELATFYNKDVTVVEFTGELAAQGNMLYKIALRQKMEKAQTLHVMLNTSCTEILDGGVEVSSVDGTSKSSLPCDTVIISTGVRADRETAEQFYGIVPQTFMIGDCNVPRKIMEATFDGYNIAANL